MKPIKCQICKVAPQSQYIFIPYGRYCNAKVESANVGDVIEFREAWRKTLGIVVRKCKVSVNSGVFGFLLKSIYGEAATWEGLRADWTALCVNEGLGSEAFSVKEVLLIEWREYIKEIYEAEQEAKRREQERRDKALAREKLLQDARERGIYNHPDIIR